MWEMILERREGGRWRESGEDWVLEGEGERGLVERGVGIS